MTGHLTLFSTYFSVILVMIIRGVLEHAKIRDKKNMMNVKLRG